MGSKPLTKVARCGSQIVGVNGLLKCPTRRSPRRNGRWVTFEPAVTERFLIITSPEVETEWPVMTRRSWIRTGRVECSSNTSSLSYLEDCFKYLPLNVNPITGSLCLFRQKQLCTRPVSLIIINPLGEECARDIDHNLPSISGEWRRGHARRVLVGLRQNSWGIGTVTEWESVKRFLFQHQNLPWKRLNS